MWNNLMFWTGLVAILELFVMVVAVHCDRRHDRCTKYGTKERERSRWWDGVLAGVLVLFVLHVVLSFIGLIRLLTDEGRGYDQEYKMKCESIEGDFSQGLNACYEEGIKVIFNEKEQVYGE